LPQESRKSLGQFFASYLEIPRDLALNLPRIVLFGDMQVIVENHLGIIEYTSGTVRVSTGVGELVIAGQELTLRAIHQEEIAVEGKIASLSFRH
jgi:sporulation protein YqfC